MSLVSFNCHYFTAQLYFDEAFKIQPQPKTITISGKHSLRTLILPLPLPRPCNIELLLSFLCLNTLTMRLMPVKLFLGKH